MADKFIPESDSAFAKMARAFAVVIAQNPAIYMLSATDADLLQNVVSDFRQALAVTKIPETRNSISIARKNESRIAAEQVIRLYANVIRPNQGISLPNKLAIGVRMKPSTLSRRLCPCSSPDLMFIGGTFGCHTLRYRDSNTPQSPARPFGARALQVFCAISAYGEPAKRDPESAKYIGEFGRNPIGIAHKIADGGKTATYFARWVGARNEHGPWSNPISATIMGAAGNALQPRLTSNQSREADNANLKIAA